MDCKGNKCIRRFIATNYKRGGFFGAGNEEMK
jgi:hypothetical protein